MTRAKTRPSVRKPVFDEATVLRFAGVGTKQAGDPTEGPADRKPPRKPDPDRESLTLMLKPESISRLKAEAYRKEKTVEQIVEKLVTKHLGKH